MFPVVDFLLLFYSGSFIFAMHAGAWGLSTYAFFVLYFFPFRADTRDNFLLPLPTQDTQHQVSEA